MSHAAQLPLHSCTCTCGERVSARRERARARFIRSCPIFPPPVKTLLSK